MAAEIPVEGPVFELIELHIVPPKTKAHWDRVAAAGDFKSLAALAEDERRKAEVALRLLVQPIFEEAFRRAHEAFPLLIGVDLDGAGIEYFWKYGSRPSSVANRGLGRQDTGARRQAWHQFEQFLDSIVKHVGFVGSRKVQEIAR